MKTIIEIKIADLNTNRIRVVDDPSHELTATLLLTGRDGKTEVAFACKRTYVGGQTLEFTTHSYADGAALIDLLTFNLTPFEVERLEGKLVRVSILDLLDTGWLLVRPRHSNHKTEVVCMAPTANVQDHSPIFTLGFVNDGTNLWAELDGAADKQALETLKLVLGKTNTKYEVL